MTYARSEIHLNELVDTVCKVGGRGVYFLNIIIVISSSSIRKQLVINRVYMLGASMYKIMYKMKYYRQSCEKAKASTCIWNK